MQIDVGLPKTKVNLGFGYPQQKKRKPFSIRTKKIEWMRASDRDPFGKFVRTSRCRSCRRSLIWKDGSYDFDHKDNNPANSSQKNCWLVCKSCHGKHTKIGIRRERDELGFIRYKTIKKKVGYKKSRRKHKPRKRRRVQRNPFEIRLPNIRI